MKKILPFILGLMLFAGLCGCGNESGVPQSEQTEQSTLKETKLVAIVEKNDSYQFEHRLVYNEKGLPVEYSVEETTGNGTDTYSAISYDEENRITTRTYSQSRSDGTVIWDEKYTYHYDANGNYVGTNEQDPSGFDYDEGGKLLTHVSEYGGDYKGCTRTVNYIYDDSGILIETETVNDYSPIGWGVSVDHAEYNYDYPPFVVETNYSDENYMFTQLIPDDPILQEIVHGLTIEEDFTFECEDGILVRAFGGDYEYEFIYE